VKRQGAGLIAGSDGKLTSDDSLVGGAVSGGGPATPGVAKTLQNVEGGLEGEDSNGGAGSGFGFGSGAGAGAGGNGGSEKRQTPSDGAVFMPALLSTPNGLSNGGNNKRGENDEGLAGGLLTGNGDNAGSQNGGLAGTVDHTGGNGGLSDVPLVKRAFIA
jgi:hypothetical protein